MSQIKLTTVRAHLQETREALESYGVKVDTSVPGGMDEAIEADEAAIEKVMSEKDAEIERLQNAICYADQMVDLIGDGSRGCIEFTMHILKELSVAANRYRAALAHKEKAK